MKPVSDMTIFLCEVNLMVGISNLEMREYALNVRLCLLGPARARTANAAASQVAGHNWPELPIADHAGKKHASVVKKREGFDHVKGQPPTRLILKATEESPRNCVRQCHDYER